MAEPKSEKILKEIKKISHNYWAVVTIVLAIVLIILLVNGNAFSTSIGKAKAGQSVVDFLNSQTGGGVELVEITSDGEFYQVMVSYQEQSIPLSVTKDGKYLAQLTQLEPITNEDTTPSEPQPADNMPQTDKPVVEAFIMSHCPYGTQIEKGLIPVVELLGDKIDFKLRQIGAMHGEYEKIEAERQLCIEQEYPDKLLNYVLDFALDEAIGKCSKDTTCSEPLVNNLFTKLGINKAKIDSCMTNDGETLYAAEEANSRSQGIGGSPTLLVNGVKTQSGRDSASYLTTICSAFNKMPAECNEVLSSASPTPGFESGASANPSTSAQC